MGGGIHGMVGLKFEYVEYYAQKNALNWILIWESIILSTYLSILELF